MAFDFIQAADHVQSLFDQLVFSDDAQVQKLALGVGYTRWTSDVTRIVLHCCYTKILYK